METTSFGFRVEDLGSKLLNRGFYRGLYRGLLYWLLRGILGIQTIAQTGVHNVIHA